MEKDKKDKKLSESKKSLTLKNIKKCFSDSSKTIKKMDFILMGVLVLFYLVASIYIGWG